MSDLQTQLDAALDAPDPQKPKRSIRDRIDGWYSALSGIGTVGKDKTASNLFQLTQITPDQAEELWRTDDLSARVIETWPAEMTREGFRLKIKCDASFEKSGDDIAEPDPDKPNEENLKNDALHLADPGFDSVEIGDQITKWWADVKILETLYEALVKERAYGGSAILLGIRDFRSLKTPLNEDTVREFTHMTVFDARELVPIQWQNDIKKPNFGEPTMFRLSPFSYGDASPSFDVHATRLITFGGIRVSRTQTSVNTGWGDSVLSRPLKVISDYNLTWGAVAILMHDFAQAIFKMKGLAEALATDNDDLIKTRWEMLEMSRSVARAVIMDSEEEFERKQTPLTGLSDILGKFESRVAAAVDMPVTLVFGQSPGGLNATGESDIRFFYDRVKSKQRSLAGVVERITRLAFKALKIEEPPKWSIEFNPLWQESAGERAITRKTVAETDVMMISSGVLFAEEVALDRYGGDEYSPDTCIDFDAREELEAIEEEKEAKEADAELEKMKATAEIAGNAPLPFGGKQGSAPPTPPPKKKE